MDLSLVYVTVVGASLGVIARFVLPGRHTYGFVLLPAIGAAVSAAIWVSVQWFDVLNFPLDWVAALAGALVASVAVALIVTRTRTASDARELHVLSGGKA
jgi:hypothetical protein